MLLKIAKISKSSYFYEINTYIREDKDALLKAEILEIFHHHKERYGYPRITLELRNRGIVVNHKKVQRLMRLLRLKAKQPKGKYNSFKGEVGKKCSNALLEIVIDETKHTTKQIRHFETSKPNEKWTTDISEFHIPAGKLYLSPILDMNQRAIVSYNISTSPNYNQVEDMLDKAFAAHHNLNGLIFHSDQGWQYRMESYQQRLKDKGIIQSMSRKGNCLDNSPMENFFGIMKNEMFYGHEYEFGSLENLQKAMEEYIEYYNNERIVTRLKGLSPIQYRQQSLVRL